MWIPAPRPPACLAHSTCFLAPAPAPRAAMPKVTSGPLGTRGFPRPADTARGHPASGGQQVESRQQPCKSRVRARAAPTPGTRNQDRDPPRAAGRGGQAPRELTRRCSVPLTPGSRWSRRVPRRSVSSLTPCLPPSSKKLRGRQPACAHMPVTQGVVGGRLTNPTQTVEITCCACCPFLEGKLYRFLLYFIF